MIRINKSEKFSLLQNHLNPAKKVFNYFTPPSDSSCQVSSYRTQKAIYINQDQVGKN